MHPCRYFPEPPAVTRYAVPGPAELSAEMPRGRPPSGPERPSRTATIPTAERHRCLLGCGRPRSAGGRNGGRRESPTGKKPLPGKEQWWGRKDKGPSGAVGARHRGRRPPGGLSCPSRAGRSCVGRVSAAHLQGQRQACGRNPRAAARFCLRVYGDALREFFVRRSSGPPARADPARPAAARPPARGRPAGPQARGPRGAAEIAADIEPGRAAGRAAPRPPCRRSPTPTSCRSARSKDDILAAIRDHQVVIVAGETGSGKTTQIPKICLELGRGVAA